jgi:hypothetical protein
VAVGDAASAAGMPLVPDSGEEGKVKWGSREINRTRDFVAGILGLIPTNKAGYQTVAGISYGTAEPTGGLDGDIYFKILPS